MRTYKIRIELPDRKPIALECEAKTLAEAIGKALLHDQTLSLGDYIRVNAMTCVTIKQTPSSALPQADLSDRPTSTQTGTASPPRQTAERAGGRRANERCRLCGNTFDEHYSGKPNAYANMYKFMDGTGSIQGCLGRKIGFVGETDNV